MPPVTKRVFPGQKVQDPSSIANFTYNESAGAEKNISVGPKLVLPTDAAGAQTANATTALKLPAKGRNLAVYNNAGAVGSITLGDATYPPVTQAPGAVQAGTEGRNFGIPCTPNDWTYIACGDQDQVVASAATLLVFIIDDNTSLKQEATK